MDEIKLRQLKEVAKSFMANERIKTKKDLDIFDNSIRKAYFDFCRTIDYKGISDADKEECICKAKTQIRTEFKEMLVQNFNIQKYDDWHEKLCADLERIFTGYHIHFCVGKSQKWINMSVKYLFSLDYDDKLKIGDRLSIFHVPIDSIVIDLAENKLGVRRPNSAWSKIEDYNTYLRYQNNVRKILQAKCLVPLEWELYEWQKPSNDK